MSDTAKNKTIVEKVYSQIKEDILCEKYLPGQHLVEADLITALNCSRTTIREALRNLKLDGLVEQVPHKGIAVKKLTKNELVGICQVLYALSGLLGQLIVEKIDEEKIEIIQKHLEKNVIQDYKSYFRILADFYILLAEMSENLMLLREVKYIYTLLIVNYRFINLEGKKDILFVCRKSIVEAIKDKNQSLSIKYIQDTVQTIMDSIELYY